MPGKPQADKGMTCPFWRKDVSKVCHTCELYVMVRGQNPQGGEIDHWHCSISWVPILTIENSQMQRQTAASVQSLRNEMATRQDATNQVLHAIAATAPVSGAPSQPALPATPSSTSAITLPRSHP